MSSLRNYRHIYREKRSLISSEAHIRQYLFEKDIFGSTQKHIFLYAIDGIAEEFQPDAENKRWRKLGRNLLKKRFFKKLLADGAQERNRLNAFVDELRHPDLTKLSDEAIGDLFRYGYKLFSRIRGYFKTSRPEFQSLAEGRLKKILGSKLENFNAVQQAFETLATPVAYDDINTEFVDWVKLVAKGGVSTHRLEEHIYRYPWIVAQSWKREEIFRILRNKYFKDRENLQNLRKRILDLKKEKNKLRLEQQRLRGRFINSKALDYLAGIFQKAALERMKLKGGWAGADFLYLPLYKEISRRTMISLQALYSFYRIGEVVKALKLHQPTVSRQELAKRKKAYVFLLQGDKLDFFSGTQAQRIMRQELKYLHKAVGKDGLTGQVASSGIARGRARIVLSGDLAMLRQSIKSFKHGDIMVTTMTQPNMVPLMKKAAAIIADEGGLISHAAIMAREFKIPSIVGTEIATKVFKDGDLVEVDAIKGLARKIR